MNHATDRTQRVTTGRSGSHAWAFISLAAVAIAAMVLFAYLASLWAAQRSLARATEVAQNFNRTTVTEQFLSSLPTVTAAEGSGRLEVASAETTETFRRVETHRTLWDMITLGETLTEIRVPVIYRYHLELDDPWEVEIVDNICFVKAPKIKPSQPPAIQTKGIEKRIETEWLSFGAEQQMDRLERNLTPALERLAGDARQIDLVRTKARSVVAEFVRRWLLASQQDLPEIDLVVVSFADELLEPLDESPGRSGEGDSGR